MGYVIVTLVVSVVGWVAAGRAGFDRAGVGAGLAAAWAVQTPSFWLLAGGLARAEPVLRVWTGGIVARVGGLGLVWAVARLLGAPTRDPVVACAFALVAYLLLEAAWLAVTGPKYVPGRAPPAGGDS